MNRRFALIQALVSLIALAAVVWWASKQDAPEFPTGPDAIAWLVGALVLYGIATLLRGERWYWILAATGVRTPPQRLLRASRRSATWATTCSLRGRARRSRSC